MKFSNRIEQVNPSMTLAIEAKAKELKAKGEDVIGFGAGEPDFDTPDRIKQAGIRAIEANDTHYTPVGGTNELKDAIIAKMKRDNGLDYDRNQIMVSCGAKHSFYNLAKALWEAEYYGGSMEKCQKRLKELHGPKWHHIVKTKRAHGRWKICGALQML